MLNIYKQKLAYTLAEYCNN